MKKYINRIVSIHKILLALLLISLGRLHAQTNTFPSSGNVGVGTNAPSAWFPGLVTEFRDNRPIIRLSPLTEGGLGTILFKGAYNTNIGTDDEFHLNYVSSPTNPKLVLSSYIGGYKNIICFSGNGTIGIGIDDAAEKLAVNGSIRSKEVKVETTNWPDYVFKPEYKLPDLSTLKTYINQNQHLPDIPSAAEVEKIGINLGELNAKLLKKIEELTLHLIEKDEELKCQEQRLLTQDKRIQAIENRLSSVSKKDN